MMCRDREAWTVAIHKLRVVEPPEAVAAVTESRGWLGRMAVDTFVDPLSETFGGFPRFPSTLRRAGCVTGGGKGPFGSCWDLGPFKRVGNSGPSGFCQSSRTPNCYRGGRTPDGCGGRTPQGPKPTIFAQICHRAPDHAGMPAVPSKDISGKDTRVKFAPVVTLVEIQAENIHTHTHTHTSTKAPTHTHTHRHAHAHAHMHPRRDIHPLSPHTGTQITLWVRHLV
jgi:hypothetical protein